MVSKTGICITIRWKSVKNFATLMLLIETTYYKKVLMNTVKNMVKSTERSRVMPGVPEAKPAYKSSFS